MTLLIIVGLPWPVVWGKLALFYILGQRLTYKLKEFGLTVNPLEIIKTICATPKVSDLYEWKISQTFSQKIGLKQGDVLSTLLFNHKWAVGFFK